MVLIMIWEHRYRQHTRSILRQSMCKLISFKTRDMGFNQREISWRDWLCSGSCGAFVLRKSYIYLWQLEKHCFAYTQMASEFSKITWILIWKCSTRYNLLFSAVVMIDHDTVQMTSRHSISKKFADFETEMSETINLKRFSVSISLKRWFWSWILRSGNPGTQEVKACYWSYSFHGYYTLIYSTFFQCSKAPSIQWRAKYTSAKIFDSEKVSWEEAFSNITSSQRRVGNEACFPMFKRRDVRHELQGSRTLVEKRVSKS